MLVIVISKNGHSLVTMLRKFLYHIASHGFDAPASARFLDVLLDEALSLREERRVRTSLKLSGLPTGQTVGNFDFSFQPGVERSRIETLATCQWIRENRTLLIQAPPGVGSDRLRGFAAGGLGVGGDDLEGLFLGGLGVGGNRLTGLSVGGLGVGGDHLTGLSIAGLAVWADEIRGTALSALHIRADELRGVHIAPWVHALHESHGLSIAAFNYSRELHGLQLGVLNWAGNNRGILKLLPLVNYHR